MKTSEVNSRIDTNGLNANNSTRNRLVKQNSKANSTENNFTKFLVGKSMTKLPSTEGSTVDQPKAEDVQTLVIPQPINLSSDLTSKNVSTAESDKFDLLLEQLEKPKVETPELGNQLSQVNKNNSAAITNSLEGKSIEVNGKATSIKDNINQLTTLLSNFEANKTSVAKMLIEDNNGEVALKDPIDKTNDLVVLLSSLLNQLTTKLQSEDLPLTKKTSLEANPTAINTVTVETETVDSMLKQISRLEAKVPQQSQQFKDVNETNAMNVIKEIKSTIQGLLSSLKAVVPSSALIDQDVKKIEVILKNLTEVVSKVENSEDIKTFTKSQSDLMLKQILQMETKISQHKEVAKRNDVIVTKEVKEIRNVNSGILSSVKLEESISNNVDVRQNDFTENSKTNAGADKILQRIAKKDSSDNNQNFANLVTRASNQNNVATTKVADNVLLNKDNMTNDVIKTVKYMNVNEIKDLTVKITPNDLGEVVIKLTQDANTMKATITTSNKEAYNLINSNLQEINDKISSNNTSIQSFSVDVFNGESSLFKQGTQQNKESNQGKKKSNMMFGDEDEAQAESIQYMDSNVNILV
ncbi:MAG: flagellar hook-length control protein FliK [Clostridiaceae bacterium]|nr:flagellar hook-length control protein FliK [Clostridiaceae bacterium]